VKVTERWYSHRMHRDITLARWGHYGTPVLLFPTAGGDAEEVERNQLLAHLAPLIEEGRVKVYSCDSVAGMALVRREGSPEHRMWLFNQFHDAVAHEVVPAIHADVQGPLAIVAAGSSIGAFNALAMTCRFPQLFGAAICMSGTYRLETLIGGPVTEDLYFASPLHFLPGLEGPRLDELRRRFVVLASGTGEWEDIGEAWAMAHVLGSKGVPNRVDDWGPQYPHDWSTWWQMLPVYLDELVP
jgi:esterase/lipase superfamily enzyme